MRDAALRVDLHVHTCWSPDARTTPSDLVERAAEVGLDRVAVTDHGEIEGALRAHALDRHRIIVGEEIRCRGRTEIIGLYLSERIPEGLALEEAVERVRDQGGVVYAPHPWAYLVTPGRHARRSIAAADIVEVFNSRAFWGRWNRRADASARRKARAAAASTDAHFPHELGRAWTEIPPFEGASGLVGAVRSGRPVARLTGSPALHVASAAWKLGRWARPVPGRDQASCAGAPLGGPAIG